ncbi:MAG: type IX secretion system membrane protein PorP/SprF [Cytophagales bacterium]|nr:MAG: type IX secretion system membrane protein PorP/SprF [Cytophagales bacterium]
MKNIQINQTKLSLFVFTILLSMQLVKAQDPVMSQYSVSPMILNPANTGVMTGGDIRAVAQYRTQWTNIVDKIANLNVAVDVPLKERWGVGGYFLNHSAPKGIGFTNFVLSGAYDITNPKQKKHKVNMGLQLGLIYKYINPDKYIWDQQYDQQAGNFNADLPSGENTSRVGIVIPETNYGISYMHIDNTHRLRPYAGFTLMHFAHPRESFYGEKGSRLPLRYVGYIGTKYIASNEIVLEPRVLFTYQRQAIQLNIGGEASYVIIPNQLNTLIGFYWRWRDAVVPTLGVEYKGILFRIAYDINTSELKEFSKGRGATEFSLVFTGNRLLTLKPKTSATDIMRNKLK